MGQAMGMGQANELLIMEGARLKGQIEAAQAQLRKINLELGARAEFRDGKQTACLFGAGYRVKISLRENVSWDQEKLLKLAEFLPKGKFNELFKVVYEPTSKKTIDGFIAHGDPDLAAGVKWCMTVKPAAPQVAYERMES